MARRKLREVPRSVNLVKVKSRHSWRVTDGSVHPVKVVKPKSLDEDEEFPEGRIIRRLHNVKERSLDASRKKKAQVLKKTGKLECEVCNFDFARYYGEEGYGFAECHHVRPLAELKGERRIRTDDLAIVCANCHRMLHKIRPWATVSQLRDRLIRMGHIK